MKNFIHFTVLAFLITSCNKDELITPAGCLPFDVSNLNVCFPGELTTEPCDYYAVYDTLNYSGSVFNPNNSDEIGFMYNRVFITQGGVTALCCLKFVIYNHITNSKVSEYTFPENIKPSSPPRWSINNRLIFSAKENSEIFCLDLNSNEFAYLLDGSGPLWSPTGEKFLFTSGTFGNAVPYFADSQGIMLDTLNQMNPLLIIADWSDSNRILFDTDYWDIENDQFYSFDFPGQNFLSIFAMRWGATDEEIVIIDNDQGLGIFNIQNEQFTLLRENCSGKYYGALSVSKDKKYIASVVSQWSVRDDDTVFITSQIRIVNTDGSDERILGIARE